ncbi:MAG: YaaR family protein [Bacillota bacterium]|nr:YaaR family protein [Bacillota bacterium]
MKVNRVSKSATSIGSRPTAKQETPKIQFTEILAKKDYDEQKRALQEALDEIDRKGRALVEERTVENLYEYKDMIRGFIEDTVHKGFELRERRGFSRTGRTKVMRTVAEIDAKLVELTNLILKREHKELNLLKKVGEIQGLLVNLVV